MDKKERASLLRKLKPATWTVFCQVEAMSDSGSQVLNITRKELSERIGINPQTFKKYFDIWESYGMVRETQNGFVIAQLDGKPSNINEEPVIREFKTSRDIVNFWCDIYEQQYDRPYVVSNWVATLSQVKTLMKYPDEEIKATLQAIVSLYERNWANPKYPRPTLGAVCSWLYEQAQPYAVVAPETTTETQESQSNLLEEMEGKGWL